MLADIHADAAETPRAPARPSGDDPPVRFRRRQKAALTGYPPLRVGDRAILLARASAGKRMWAKRHVSVWAATSETITSGQAASARSPRGCQGATPPGWYHDPALTSPRPMAANSSTAVSPGCASRSVPEAGQPLQIVWHKIHVRRQHRRQPADFAAAHGVGLTGQRKGPQPRPYFPLARWTLMMALHLSLPLAD